MGRRAYRDTPAVPPGRRPAGARFSGVLPVQRLAGNRTTRRLLRDDKPGERVPKGIEPADAAGSTHTNALSLDSHFGQAPAALPKAGAPAGAVAH